MIQLETFADSDLIVVSGRTTEDERPYALDRKNGRFLACLSEGTDAGARAARTVAEEKLDASGTALLAIIEADALRFAWVGGLEAIVARMGEIVHRTTPQYPSLAPNRRLPIDTAGPWLLRRGDLVLLVSRKIHELLTDIDLEALSNRVDVMAIVKGILTTASTRTDAQPLYAIALRIL